MPTNVSGGSRFHPMRRIARSVFDRFLFGTSAGVSEAADRCLFVARETSAAFSGDEVTCTVPAPLGSSCSSLERGFAPLDRRALVIRHYCQSMLELYSTLPIRPTA